MEKDNKIMKFEDKRLVYSIINEDKRKMCT